MASACVNNIGMSPEKNFLDCSPTYTSYGWLSPRISFGRDMPEEEASKTAGAARKKHTSPAKIPTSNVTDLKVESDPEVSAKDFGDFEFRLEDPVMMLPADELLSDGKLFPLQLSMIRSEAPSTTPIRVRSPDTLKFRRKMEISGSDPYLFSPKAPRCSSRWKELLGLRKLYQSSNVKPDSHKTTSSLSSSHGNGTTKSLKNFLHRSSKSSSDSSINLPLLKDSDTESLSVSSRLSLSSSSSGHCLDNLPRLSLDSEKPGKVTVNAPRMRVVKTRTTSTDNNNLPLGPRVGRSPMRRPVDSANPSARGVSVDSPRMNSSGKIVFHSLERSSSSPSSFNGGPRFKHRGMERSYSANVRITPVLNVPVCSIRGLFSTPQKKEGGNGGNGGVNKSQQSSNGKNRTTDRT